MAPRFRRAEERFLGGRVLAGPGGVSRARGPRGATWDGVSAPSTFRPRSSPFWASFRASRDPRHPFCPRTPALPAHGPQQTRWGRPCADWLGCWAPARPRFPICKVGQAWAWGRKAWDLMEGLVESLSVLASDTPGSSPRAPLPAVSEPHWEQSVASWRRDPNPEPYLLHLPATNCETPSPPK